MSKFKVGDAVRMKVDFQRYPPYTLKGKKLIVSKVNISENGIFYDFVDDEYGVWQEERFEPWNDSEEWDGEKWVAKKVPGFKTEPHLDINYFGEPPVTVTIGGVNYIREEQSVYAICDLPYATKPKPVQFLYNGVPVSIEVEDWKPPQPKPAIVILREDGVLKPNSNPIVHESTSKAKEEAKRLAEKHKGKEFVVFQEVDRKRVEKPVYPELKRGDVMRAKHKVDLRCGWTVADGEIVIVEDNGDELFGVWRGSQYLALHKSGFIKIGHVDL